MSVNELLGSDNQARLKELAKDTLSAESTLKNLASEDPSSRRDAALIVFDRACNKPPTLENTTLVNALGETLKPPLPRAQESIDALAWATSAEAALAALWSLDAEVDQIHDALLLCVIPYAKARKPWVTMTAASTAERLLDRYRPGEKKQDFIITGVLERYLRPIFSKSTSAVTAEGRPALFRESLPPDGGFHAQRASWKDAGPHIVAVFHWAVEASEPATMKRHWPLYIPVLVTLVEDADVAVRQRGIDILDRFLATCPAAALRASGIDAVFQESLLPSLLFLPSLTPEAESVPLLRAAYRTLLRLALAADDDDNEARGRKRRALLDKVLREGVLAGYFHASQHIRVVEVLMQSAEQIVEALQVYAVKHLQSLLDLFAPVLTDAFALAHVPAVIAAAKALNTTILNCWPRIVGTPHAEQITSIVARCWTNIYDTDHGTGDPEMEALTQELKKTMALLASLWKASDEPMPTDKLAQVVQKAPHLKPLFTPFQLEAPIA